MTAVHLDPSRTLHRCRDTKLGRKNHAILIQICWQRSEPSRRRFGIVFVSAEDGETGRQRDAEGETK